VNAIATSEQGLQRASPLQFADHTCPAQLQNRRPRFCDSHRNAGSESARARSTPSTARSNGSTGI